MNKCDVIQVFRDLSFKAHLPLVTWGKCVWGEVLTVILGPLFFVSVKLLPPRWLQQEADTRKAPSSIAALPLKSQYNNTNYIRTALF